MLQKIQIMLLLGIAVAFCASGCEEDASMQADKTRPVNNQPGTAAPPPADAPPSVAAAKPVKASPSVKPTPAVKPVAIRKAAPSSKVPAKTSSKVTTTKQTARNNTLSPEQVQLFDSLKQDSLKLQMKLDELQERNEKLTRALVDSRTAGRTMQSNLQRTTIVQEIQKRQLVELKERLGDATATATPDAGKTNSATPVEPARRKKSDPVNLMLQIGRLQRKIETLQLQLELAKLDTPDARDKVLLQLGEVTEKYEELEKTNRKLSHMVVTQADQIRQLQKREEETANLQAEHAEQIARMDRKTRKELATMEIQMAEDRKKITALKNQLARREYQVRTLNSQLASAKAEAAKRRPVAVAAAKPKPEAPAPAGRAVWVKVAPASPKPAAKKPVPAAAAKPAPNPIAKPSPVQPAAPTPKPALAVAHRETPVEVTPAPTRPTIPVEQPIHGKITAMKGLMVMVDVGKDYGVEEGMRLIAYRDDKFVGYLRVEQVGRRESVCSFSRQILPPELGDHVVDRLE